MEYVVYLSHKINKYIALLCKQIWINFPCTKSLDSSNQNPNKNKIFSIYQKIKNVY